MRRYIPERLQNLTTSLAIHVVILAAISVARALTANAAIYYVATTGNDADSGSQSRPFRTINSATTLLKPGDTLFIQSGTYTESVHKFTRGTSWALPITIAAYPGDIVTIRPRAGDAYNPLFFAGAGVQYIIVDRLILEAMDVPWDGIKITDGAHHIRIQNSEIRNNIRGNGVLITKGSNFVELIGNKIYNNGNAGAVDGSALHGIYCSGSNTLIERNEVYNNAHNGISCGDEVSGTNRDIIIRYNIARDNGTCPTSICKGWINGTGILAWHGQNYLVYRNLIYNNRGDGREASTGIWLENTLNALVYKNTIYNNAGAGVYNSSGSSGAVIRSNIAFGNGTTNGATLGGGGSNASISENLTGG